MDRKGLSTVLLAFVFLLAVADAPGSSWGLKLRGLMAEVKENEQNSSSPATKVPPLDSKPLSPTPKPSNQSSTGGGNSGPTGSGSVTPPVPDSSSNLPSPSDSPSNPSPSSGSPSDPPPPAPVVGNSSVAPPPPPLGNPSNPPPPTPLSHSPPSQPPVSAHHPNKPSPSGPTNGTTLKGPAGSNNSPVTNEEVPKCGAAATRCWGSLVACLWHPQNDSKKIFLLVHNEGENAVTVTVITAPSTDKNVIPLPKNHSKKIAIPAIVADNLKIVLGVGDRNCTLPRRSRVPDNIFQQLPAYAARMTPIYGAYAVFLTALIAGGTWVCCRFGRRGRRIDTGVSYQQLEMGVQPPSNSAVDTNTAYGWDQGWDDDWDDEEAVSQPPDKQHEGNGSANGLPSKSSSKDGWEDWDD